MVNMRKVVRSLKYEIFKNIILSTFLKTMVVFFVFDIIKSFMDFSFTFSYIAAGAYFMIVMLKRAREINIKVFEKHNPEIKEMLTTAADNVRNENTVVLELFKEVMQKLKKVSSGTIIMPGTIMMLIIAIPVLALIDFQLTPVRIDAISQEAIMQNLEKVTFIKNIFKKANVDDSDDVIEESELLDDEDIYGERSVAILGDNEIDIKLNLGYETDLTKPREEDIEQTVFTDFPTEDDTVVAYDASSRSEVLEISNEAKLAREYNERIRNMDIG